MEFAPAQIRVGGNLEKTLEQKKELPGLYR